MQYKIPQEISAEDKLIGPLSLRQLIIVGVGSGMAYLIYISLVRVADPIVYIPFMVIIILLSLAVAFFKKDNMTFTRMILYLLEMAINPTQRIWVGFAGNLSPFKLIETFSQADVQKTDKKATRNEKAIEDIDKLVQIIDYNPSDEIQREQEKQKEQMRKEENSTRANFIERLASEAAKKAAVGIKKKQGTDQKDENLYIKQEQTNYDQ